MLTPIKTPLWDALRHHSMGNVGFHTPGHNRGVGLPTTLEDWKEIARFDLSELEGLDSLHAPTGVIAEAQSLAAEAWGAERTWFLVNGSSAGIEAMLLAATRPEERILIPRNCHQSVIHGLVLSGAVPVFLEPAWDPQWQLAHGLTAGAVDAALRQDPHIRAVLLVHPTYFGAVGETRAIAEVVHARGLPLLVDAAHGAHLHFHPELPECALACGADLVVHSAHKTLPALTQSALLHQQGTRIDPERVARALRLVQSTSPSYLLMASLDCARAWMVEHGARLLGQTQALAERVHQLSPLPCLRRDRCGVIAGLADLDPTRLVIDVASHGWTGYAAEEWIAARYGVYAELGTFHQLVFILNTAHRPADIDQLLTALSALACAPRTLLPAIPPLPPVPPQVFSPRRAFEYPHGSVSFEEAIGRISAQTVSAYPPGTPVLVAGERVTSQVCSYLDAVRECGGWTSGLAHDGQFLILLD